MAVTTDPDDPRLNHGVDEEPTEQSEVYLIAPHEGDMVRPFRHSYIHAEELGGCGATTTMDRSIAETFARNPTFYGATYCVGCRMHRPVGEAGEFYWFKTTMKVGT